MDFLCIFCLGIERTTMNINCLSYVSTILSRKIRFYMVEHLRNIYQSG